MMMMAHGLAISLRLSLQATGKKEDQQYKQNKSKPASTYHGAAQISAATEQEHQKITSKFITSIIRLTRTSGYGVLTP
jgi:hypothetical protein